MLGGGCGWRRWCGDHDHWGGCNHYRNYVYDRRCRDAVVVVELELVAIREFH